MVPAVADRRVVVAASIESDWDGHTSLPISGGDGKTSGVLALSTSLEVQRGV
jgi:hypothetical protein